MKLRKPTYDELFALVQHQSKIVFEQEQTIKRLEKTVAELEEKLKLNSKNSSKPPSTDQKGANDVPKKKGGAKPGHPGHFRPLFSAAQVDAFVNLRAENCPSCGEAVQPSGEPPSIHQQVEIAPKPYIVTQYILLPPKKCESAGVGQPLNLCPVCIAKLFKFSCFDAGFAWLKFRAPPWHFSLFLNGRSITERASTAPAAGNMG
jgi:hypothetical protein